MNRPLLRLPMLTGWLAVALVGLAAFGTTGASADQTIQVTSSPDPTIDGVPTVITVTGSSDTGGSVFVALDGSNATCGSNPSADDGSMLISGDSVAGPQYEDSQTITPVAGGYLLCAWLMPAGDDGSGTPLAGPESMPVDVQPLQSTVSLSAPVSVPFQHSIPVTVNWAANTGGSLFVQILPTSYGPCTADPSSEPQYVGWLSGQGGYTNNDPIGQDAATGTDQYSVTELVADTYQLCAWVEETSGAVVAGPVSVDVQMNELPGSRTYSGLTSQHLPIAVTLTGYTVQDIVYSARFKCGAPEYFSTGLRWNGIWEDSVLTAANFGILSVSDGQFEAALDANPSNRVDLRGTLTSRQLTGSLDAVKRIAPPQFKGTSVCRTGHVRFAIGLRRPPRPKKPSVGSTRRPDAGPRHRGSGGRGSHPGRGH